MTAYQYGLLAAAISSMIVGGLELIRALIEASL